MPPCLARDDVTDGELAHVEFLGELALCRSPRRIACADLARLCRGEMGAAVALPGATASFLNHIALVVSSGAEEQMIGSDAHPIVATVTYAEAGRYAAITASPKPASLCASDAPVKILDRLKRSAHAEIIDRRSKGGMNGAAVHR